MWLVYSNLNYEDVTFAELGLEVLRAAETFKASVDHDRQPRAQCLALLHAAHTGVWR